MRRGKGVQLIKTGFHHVKPHCGCAAGDDGVCRDAQQPLQASGGGGSCAVARLEALLELAYCGRGGRVPKKLAVLRPEGLHTYR